MSQAQLSEQRLFAGPFEPGVFLHTHAPTGMHADEFISPASVATRVSHGGTAEAFSLAFRLPSETWKDALSGVFTNVSSIGTTHVLHVDVSNDVPTYYDMMAPDRIIVSVSMRDTAGEPQSEAWRGVIAIDRPREIVFSKELQFRTASLRRRESHPPFNLCLPEPEE